MYMKRILILYLMLLAFVTGANAIDYNLKIDNTWVTSDNASDIKGNGVFSYNASTNTLYIKGSYTSTATNYASIVDSSISGLTVVICNDAVLTNNDGAIFSFSKSTSITGSGKLTLRSSGECGFYLTNGASLTIYDADDIDINTKWGIAGPNNQLGEKLIINNSNVDITTGGSGIAAICDLSGGLELVNSNITAPEGAYFDTKDLKNPDGSIAKNVTIAMVTPVINGITYKLYSYSHEATVIRGNDAEVIDAPIPASITHNGVSYTVTAIGPQAFKDCTRLNEVTIPSSVKSIGSAAFQGCLGLSYIGLPEGVTSIGEYAFDGCNLLGTVALPSTLATIGSGAFRDCAVWMHVYIHSEIPPTIDSSVFSNGINILDVKDGYISAYQNAAGWQEARQIKEMTCISGIKYEFHDDMTATVLGWCDTYPWLDCSYSVVYMDGYLSPKEYMVTEFNPWSLASSNLSSVVLPENLTTIPEGLFSYCYSLTEIIIPGSVTSIGMFAFYNTPLTAVVSNMENPPSISENVFTCYDTATLYVPAGSVEAYQNAPVWKKFTIRPNLAGDVDGDGMVDVADFTVLANYLLGKNPANFHSWAADVAGSTTGGPDGEIDVADLTGVANIILHGGGASGVAPMKQESKK